MINANDARKQAESSKGHIVQSSLLQNHFEQLIKKASNQGKFAIEKQTFPADRFTSAVIDEVVGKLELNGFKVERSKKNSTDQVVFDITW